MSKPNRVVAYLPKRPFDAAGSFFHAHEAEKAVADLKAQGFDAKFTRMATGPRRNTRWVYNVWKRENA